MKKSIDDPSGLQIILDRPIAYHRIFTKVSGGGVTAGVLLSQLLYWSSRGKDPDGWIYKTFDEWEDETGLTRSEFETARKHLIKSGILKYKLKGRVPPVGHYKIDFDKLQELITQFVGNQQIELQETSKSNRAKSANLNTETTAENTTDIIIPQEKAPAEAVDEKPSSTSPIHKIMFGLLVKICKVDAKLKAGQIGKTAKELIQAGYSPDDLERFEIWWKQNDFRGRRGETPGLAQVIDKIYQSKNERFDPPVNTEYSGYITLPDGSIVEASR